MASGNITSTSNSSSGSDPVRNWAISGENYYLRGAGMGNVVIGFIRDNDHFVWRINKTAISLMTNRNCEESSDHEYVVLIRYIRDIMGPIFRRGPPFIFVPTLVRLRDDQVKEVRRLLPCLINDGQSLPSSCLSALEMPDWTMFLPSISSGRYPVICVEIKPKQGYISDDLREYVQRSFSSQGDVDICYCMNCMVQYEKCHAKGNGTRVYDYCPLDLYSGDEKRMRRAINDLLRSRHMHLRIFRNGRLVSNGGLSSDKVVNLLLDGSNEPIDLIGILIRLLRYSNKQTDDSGLPSGCVLDLLLHGQKLDRLGPLKAGEIFEELRPISGQISSDPFSVFFGDNCSLDAHHQSKVEALRGSLICATLRDCSIMITMQATSDCPSHSKNDTGEFRPFPITDRLWLNFGVKIIDLDFKSPLKLPRWRQRCIDAVGLLKTDYINGTYKRVPCHLRQ